eukprot:5913934-Amphidinium_carterae.1
MGHTSAGSDSVLAQEEDGMELLRLYRTLGTLCSSALEAALARSAIEGPWPTLRNISNSRRLRLLELQKAVA